MMKWIVLLLMLIILDTHAFNIGTKGRYNANAIHTTYFLTPNNNLFPVKAQAYVGFWSNNYCRYNAIYPIGTEQLRSGDFVDIDAFQLKSVVGAGYDCMTIYYTYRQLVMESFQLFWDGFNYKMSNPPVSEVNIL